MGRRPVAGVPGVDLRPGIDKRLHRRRVVHIGRPVQRRRTVRVPRVRPRSRRDAAPHVSLARPPPEVRRKPAPALPASAGGAAWNLGRSSRRRRGCGGRGLGPRLRALRGPRTRRADHARDVRFALGHREIGRCLAESVPRVCPRAGCEQDLSGSRSAPLSRRMKRRPPALFLCLDPRPGLDQGLERPRVADIRRRVQRRAAVPAPGLDIRAGLDQRLYRFPLAVTGRREKHRDAAPPLHVGPVAAGHAAPHVLRRRPLPEFGVEPAPAIRPRPGKRLQKRREDAAGVALAARSLRGGRRRRGQDARRNQRQSDKQGKQKAGRRTATAGK